MCGRYHEEKAWVVGKSILLPLLLVLLEAISAMMR